MSMPLRSMPDIPEETAMVAKRAHPNGNNYIQMRDLLGPLYADETFADLFAVEGQPGEQPWRLALVTVMQFAEGLTDRQTADAVRDRISWKYALGLELTDTGFDHTVLSEFRTRLVEHAAEERLFEGVIRQLVERGLLKARGRQRTDSTHVLAAIRTLNRLELVGQTLHHALNSIAAVAPDWLKTRVSAEWFERYGKRFDGYRLPKGKAERKVLAEQIGRDGLYLFRQVCAEGELTSLRRLEAVETLRLIWVQQYYLEDDQIAWREGERSGPPSAIMISSPYDLEARYCTKREIQWVGYKVHLSESCDEQHPHLITHVETTPSTVQDVEVVEHIHECLAEKGLLPTEHVLDMGYISTDLIVNSQRDFQVELVGEVRPDTSVQATAQTGFDLTHFTVDWEHHQATCPMGQTSSTWKPPRPSNTRHRIAVGFSKATCEPCPCRDQCTSSRLAGRQLALPADKATFDTLCLARAYQQTEAFKNRYKVRAGIEGTLSQAVNALDIRPSRYIGLAKTHLQHVLTATALNILRTVNWLLGQPLAKTRTAHFLALAPLS